MLELTLWENNIGAITWSVDASSAVHNDCKGQSERMIVLGMGVITSFSCKQKLNAKSSTEAELIGIDDALPQVLWTRYFLEAQGFTISTYVIMQYNVSEISKIMGRLTTQKKQTYPCDVFFY